MTDPEKNKILKRIEKIEAFAEAILNEATALRKMELEGSGVSTSSPQKGKAKKAALAVLKNRRINVSKKSQL
ncbi:hypothetical protein V6B16_11450 [Salinimicrobium catena]|uniref:hypothetical protein n=1 Tax=Salinimicrobium catena TaxID=390640 RepID=UPI002FE4F499